MNDLIEELERIIRCGKEGYTREYLLTCLEEVVCKEKEKEAEREARDEALRELVRESQKLGMYD